MLKLSEFRHNHQPCGGKCGQNLIDVDFRLKISQVLHNHHPSGVKISAKLY